LINDSFGILVTSIDALIIVAIFLLIMLWFELLI